MILDTNAISAVADGDLAIQESFSSAPVVAIPVIALGEYRFGLAQSKQRAQYEQWLAEHLGDFRTLNVDVETSVNYAEIHLELKRAGSPIPVNDLWIAALARQHRLPILSRDRHFDVVKGIRRIGW